ncbi:MAG: tRNA (guanosine(46)-N7)-methyltransferase TrmB [Bacteroidales bacterium]|nr:tRNA (guanosine(46)-N7)-methyltransferase TrmB [Bacteroidales bacterium]
MSRKNKLAKFRENQTFECLIQPLSDDMIADNFSLKGHWNEQVFHNDNPIVLELGCGKGEYTIALAKHNLNINYIGIDIKGARLWKGAKEATLNNMPNVAFLRTRIDFIRSAFGSDEVSEIWITFADPQPKNANKRLTSPVFLDRYRSFLKKGSIINLKTDSQLLHKYSLETAIEQNLEILEYNSDIYGSGRVDNPNDILNVKTFYEQQFLAKGIPITYLAFKL